MNDTNCSRPVITAPTFANTSLRSVTSATAVTSPKGKQRAEARIANRLTARAGKSQLGDRVVVWSVVCEGGLVDIQVLSVRNLTGEMYLTQAAYYDLVRTLAAHLQPDCTISATLN